MVAGPGGRGGGRSWWRGRVPGGLGWSGVTGTVPLWAGGARPSVVPLSAWLSGSPAPLGGWKTGAPAGGEPGRGEPGVAW